LPVMPQFTQILCSEFICGSLIHAVHSVHMLDWVVQMLKSWRLMVCNWCCRQHCEVKPASTTWNPRMRYAVILGCSHFLWCLRRSSQGFNVFYLQSSYTLLLFSMLVIVWD
jgi:hypothetical protein